MDQMMQMALHPAMNQANSVLTGAIGAGGSSGLSQASMINPAVYAQKEAVFRQDMWGSIVVRYERAENGWIVSIARAEGELTKRYVASTLDEAHKQVSAHIAAERLDR